MSGPNRVVTSGPDHLVRTLGPDRIPGGDDAVTADGLDTLSACESSSSR